MFSCVFFEFFKNTYFVEHLRTAASDSYIIQKVLKNICGPFSFVHTSALFLCTFFPYFTLVTFFMLHLFSRCAFFMLHFFRVEILRVALFTCCTLFMLQFFPLVLFSSCTLLILQHAPFCVLHFFHAALISC